MLIKAQTIPSNGIISSKFAPYCGYSLRNASSTARFEAVIWGTANKTAGTPLDVVSLAPGETSNVLHEHGKTCDGQTAIYVEIESGTLHAASHINVGVR